MPDRLRLSLATLTILALAGCGGGAPEAAPTPSASSLGPSSAGPSSASRTPSATSAAPSSPSATPTRSASATPEDGTYGTDLSVSEDGALSYVPLRWYEDANAEARCAEEDIEAEGAWCTDYYFEKSGSRTAATLTEDTAVRLLDEDSRPADASLADLVQAIEDDNWPNFQIAVSGGRVTRITQVFTP